MERPSVPQGGLSASATTPVLSAQALVKRYGEAVALDELSLDVVAGECVALVGESGSGKTTLLRSFNGLVRPDAGRVLVESTDLSSTDLVALRRRIGYVPQDGGLLPHWSVGRNVELVLRLLDQRSLLTERRDEALRLVGLDPAVFMDRRPGELSGGQRQRVAIARALAASPSLLLLDEPFGALDAITRADLQQSFLVLRERGVARSMTCVLVTHDLHEAFLLADRIAVLRRGRLEQIGTPADLVRAPRTPYVRDLLARARIESVAS
ncbi:MAG TPA: ATP-binding cassette domain-containing protein [Gemmatimonadaceae bacterium]|nr:ATP-binding cassette domain-containing protein [Gemmatimonadaceae bacterium]